MILFLALDVPHFTDIKTKIVRPNVSIPQEAHLSLKFFGDVSPGECAQLKDTLENLSFKAFSFVTHPALSSFANWNRCRTLYVGSDSKQLIRLSKSINTIYGVRYESKKYLPHISVGRVKQKLSSADVRELRELIFEPVEIRVESVTLYQSKLVDGVVTYIALKKVKLN